MLDNILEQTNIN